MKIFIGHHEIAGIIESLEKGFSENSISAMGVLSSKHKYEYGNIRIRNKLVQVWQILGDVRNQAYNKSKIMFLLFFTLHWFFSFAVLAWAIFAFNVFIFTFGETITNTRFEIFLLKLLGKKIIFIYLGSDSRPPFVDGNYYGDTVDIKKIISRSKSKKKQITFYEKYADAMINSPFTSQFSNRLAINWFSIGFAKELMPYQEFKMMDKIRILHAPSNPKIKGTYYIDAAVQRLIDKGYRIDFIKINGVSNKVVVQELKKCDFVVDQVYSDTPLAGLASEAACLGKPSVVSGYAAGKISDICQEDDIPPSLYVLPDDLESAIERLICDHEYRKKLGEDAHSFMAKKWSRELVAKRILRVINDDIPEEWTFNPNDVIYLEGVGVSRKDSKDVIKKIIEQHGIKSLQLTDKPLLQRAYLEYCEMSGENE